MPIVKTFAIVFAPITALKGAMLIQTSIDGSFSLLDNGPLICQADETVASIPTILFPDTSLSTSTPIPVESLEQWF